MSVEVVDMAMISDDRDHASLAATGGNLDSISLSRAETLSSSSEDLRPLKKRGRLSAGENGCHKYEDDEDDRPEENISERMGPNHDAIQDKVLIVNNNMSAAVMDSEELHDRSGRKHRKSHRKHSRRSSDTEGDRSQDSSRKSPHGRHRSSRPHHRTGQFDDADEMTREKDWEVDDGRPENSSLKDKKSIHVVPAGDGALVFLDHPQDVYLRGRASVQVVCGTISIMEYDLRPDNEPYNIYSPSCCSLLTLHTKEGSGTDASSVLDKIAAAIGKHFNPKDFEMDFGETTVVILCTKLTCSATDYISSMPLYSHIFNSVDKRDIDRDAGRLPSVDLSVLRDTRYPVVSLSEDYRFCLDAWRDALAIADETPSVMICGGKDSGKSTFNRLMLNTALNCVDKVCFLECDVGQTEFTPSGCVSLNVVTEPLLGPPFTHQREPTWSCCFGGLSPADNPTHYIKCIEDVYQHYLSMNPRPPLVINTMGWNKGLGVCLLIDSCIMTRPSKLIQLDLSNPASNFPMMTSDYVKVMPGWVHKESRSRTEMLKDYQHKLTAIDSVVQPLKFPAVRHRPMETRDLALFAWFGQRMGLCKKLAALTPYYISFADIAIHICHSSVSYQQMMYSLNAGLVALCIANHKRAQPPLAEGGPKWFDTIPVCQWLGYGIVRGVDMEKMELCITTPLPIHSLRSVNTLLQVTMALPESELLKQMCHQPSLYVDNPTLSAVGANPIKPRRYMKRKSRPSPD